jgi:hypothetical protein
MADIILGERNISFKNVQPAFTTIEIPCEEIMTASNYSNSNGVIWIFGAREGTGSSYEYVSEYFFQNPDGASGSDTGYFGYQSNAITGNCESGEFTFQVDEYLPSAEYVLILKYDVEGGYTNEEWYNFNVTNPFGMMTVLFVCGAMLYGGIKLINALLPSRPV